MSAVIDLFGRLDDDWAWPGDGEELGQRNRVVLSPDRIRETWKKPSSVNREAGVAVEVDTELNEIAPWLPHLAMVVLEFPSFADGRAFSQARLLRSRYGFRGIIRARGQVVRDQLAFMQRCGFNQFELAAEEDVEDALSAFGDISLSYQPELKQAVSA